MRRIDHPRTPGGRRAGKTLVTFVIAAPVLLGMVGLVIDSGLLLATQRMAQNTADAAALAAAMELFRGSSTSSALTAANSFVTANSPSSSSLTLYTSNAGTSSALNIPPGSASQYAGNGNYAEAYVSIPFVTSFIQVLGINSSQTVTARAVAGFEPISAGQGAIVLNPNVAPGINLNGSGTRLIVNGGITDNSMGGGVDQYGNTVTSSLGNNTYGFRTSTSTQNTAPVVAMAIWVQGGIDTLDNYRVYDSSFTNFYDSNNPDRPVFANTGITAPDPFTPTVSPQTTALATPTTSNGVVSVQTYPKFLGGNNQWDNTPTSPQSFTVSNGDTATFPQGTYGNITINGGTATLSPGIYSSIGIGGGGTVTMNSGIYVLNAAYLNGSQPVSFSTGNGSTVTGSGVMIYNTGSDYNPATGSPDSSDLNNTPNPPNSTQFGQVALNGGTVNLSPPTSGTFSGIVFYQRRWNTLGAGVGGNSNNVNVTGTIYDKWGTFTLSGQGQYNAEFVVGSLVISGGSAVTINATGKNQGRVNQVFLVE
jgi:Flp pilus assembly protein TadG